MKDFINNLNVPNISLEGLNVFYDFTDSLYRCLKNNEINTLEELLKAYQDKKINLYNMKKKTRQRLDGIVDLLSFKYLGKDLPFANYFDTNVSNDMNVFLSRMGFDYFETSLIYSVLNENVDDLKMIDLLVLARKKYEEKQEWVTNYKHLKLYKVLINKLDILINYYLKLKSIDNQGVNSVKIDFLTDEIKKLKLLKDDLEKQISLLENALREETEKKSKIR